MEAGSRRGFMENLEPPDPVMRDERSLWEKYRRWDAISGMHAAVIAMLPSAKVKITNVTFASGLQLANHAVAHYRVEDGCRTYKSGPQKQEQTPRAICELFRIYIHCIAH